MKNGHAEHIHANCDCQYAVRFDGRSTVEGYDPDEYLEMYENAEGSTTQEKLNSMRRAIAAEKREKSSLQSAGVQDWYGKHVEGSATSGQYRRKQNIGAFSDLEEVMELKHVKKVVSDMGLNLGKTKIQIVRDVEMLKSSVYGYTFPDGSKVQLYPNAFRDRERMVRTLGHEYIHLQQIKKVV